MYLIKAQGQQAAIGQTDSYTEAVRIRDEAQGNGVRSYVVREGGRGRGRFNPPAQSPCDTHCFCSETPLSAARCGRCGKRPFTD